MSLSIRLYRDDDFEAFDALAEEASERYATRTGRQLLLTHPGREEAAFTLLAIDGHRLVGAATARHMMEAGLLLDASWSGPGDRWELVKTLLAEGGRRCRALGVRDLVCPTLSVRFAKRLLTLGGAMGDPRPHVTFNLEHRNLAQPREEIVPDLLVPVDAVTDGG